MENNRNFFVTIALSVLILTVWQVFYMGPRIEEQKKQAAIVAQEQAAKAGQATPAPGATATPAQPGNATAPGGEQPAAAAATVRRIKIETPALTGSINLTGARLDELVLKNYQETVDKSSPNIQLLYPSADAKGYFAEMGYASTAESIGRAVPNVTDWQYLNLNYVTKAKINQDDCIKCGRCYAACEDTSHQAIAMSADRTFSVIDAECVACNLCADVCPVENCITMEPMQPGQVDPRTGKVVQKDYANWTTHPNNPGAVAAE